PCAASKSPPTALLTPLSLHDALPTSVPSSATMPLHRTSGRVAGVVGHEVDIRGLRLRVGDAVSIDTAGGRRPGEVIAVAGDAARDRESTRLDSSHVKNSHAVFCL